VEEVRRKTDAKFAVADKVVSMEQIAIYQIIVKVSSNIWGNTFHACPRHRPGLLSRQAQKW
jgi:hypothetical protein